jgi:conjugal transfer/entry exclusion protein
MSAKIHHIEIDPRERAERRLRGLWADEDRLVAELAATRAAAQSLGREVAKSRGFFLGASREVLEREMRRN